MCVIIGNTTTPNIGNTENTAVLASQTEEVEDVDEAAMLEAALRASMEGVEEAGLFFKKLIL